MIAPAIAPHLSPPDTREIWEWIAEEGELPSAYSVPGKFDVATCPMAKGPFLALRNKRVRDVVVMASVQSLKTLIGELWIPWAVCNDSGPTQVVFPDDVEAGEHCEERLQPLLRNFPILERYYSPDRHKRKQTAIMFLHMWLRIEGANNKGNAQRKGVKNQFCSEIWQGDKWKPGRLKEFAARLTQFDINSKRYIESQPGMVASMRVDDMHQTYLEGNQQVWYFPCQGCGLFQPFQWSVLREDGSRAGMRWDTNEKTTRETNSVDINEIYKWSELRSTIRYECIKCGHAHHDDPLIRRRMLAGGKFVAENPNAPIEVESFCWNQLSLPNLDWFQTKVGGVKNFLAARMEAKRGFDTLQKDFFQKVLAQPYDPDKFAAVSRLELASSVGSLNDDIIESDGIKFDHRLMGVDVQESSFWILVEAWNKNGDSITLWGGEVFSWDEVSRKQQEFKVNDKDVSIDISHRGQEVKYECATRGHFEEIQGKKQWACWKALRGSDQKSFLHIPAAGPKKGEKIYLPYSWPPEKGDPKLGRTLSPSQLKELDGKYCQVIAWSNPTIKDVVMARRDGKAKGVKCLVVRGEWNEIYNKHMHSQRKMYQGKFGIGNWKYERFRDDHLLDCKCEIVVRAFMKNLIGGVDLTAVAEPLKDS